MEGRGGVLAFSSGCGVAIVCDGHVLVDCSIPSRTWRGPSTLPSRAHFDKADVQESEPHAANESRKAIVGEIASTCRAIHYAI
jgi:hypothetical protein